MRPLAALTCLVGIFCGCAYAAAPPQCSAASSERRVPLLELYTSEGCDSCPPVDKWLSDLPGRGLAPDRVVALAFHVDYWDYIGWRDPYAQRAFSDRQRIANARNGSRQVYTPQLVLNGRDFRDAAARNDIAGKIAELAGVRAKAAIRLSASAGADPMTVTGAWSASDAATARHGQGWLALYENRLSSSVRAGENRGKRLEHDFVVRELAGPFPAGELSHAFKIDARWKRSDLGVAAFVLDASSGEALQALALTGCRTGS